MTKKRHIWLSRQLSEAEINDTSVDVIVTLPDRTRWMATFFTFQNIKTLRQKYKETGVNLSGTYLWAVNMIICEDLSRETIEKVVDDIIADERLASAMMRISDVTNEAGYEEGFFEV
ncbi:MAG: hypothetical protein DF221_09260 [Brevibacillus sp.]|jgi:hypothetical protein|nr:MAG: hypothetical protein DF221_09260 [Brevibacillus sp.]